MDEEGKAKIDDDEDEDLEQLLGIDRSCWPFFLITMHSITGSLSHFAECQG